MHDLPLTSRAAAYELDIDVTGRRSWDTEHWKPGQVLLAVFFPARDSDPRLRPCFRHTITGIRDRYWDRSGLLVKYLAEEH